MKAAAWGDGDPRYGCKCPNCGGTNTTGARATEKFADGTWDFANAACSDCANGFSFDFDAGKAVKQTTGPRGQKRAVAEPADREDCPNCGVLMERGEDGTCNSCGGDWPAKTAALLDILAAVPANSLMSLLGVH